MEPAAQPTTPPFWRCCLAGAWDFFYAALCSIGYVGWLMETSWADSWLGYLRWWPAYEGLSFLGLIALFIIFNRAGGKSFLDSGLGYRMFAGGFVTLCLVFAALFSKEASGGYSLLIFFASFMATRLVAFFLNKQAKPIVGAVELIVFLTVAFFPILGWGVLLESLNDGSPRMEDLTEFDRSSVTLVGMGIAFYLLYGVFHVYTARRPEFDEGKWMTVGKK